MTIEIAEQPMPIAIAEACELLSAAERYEGDDPTDPATIRAGGRAGDALSVLLDVVPRYAASKEDLRPRPLATIEVDVRAALTRAAAKAGSVEERLRIARAVRVLNEDDS